MRFTNNGFQTTEPCYFCGWHFLVPITLARKKTYGVGYCLVRSCFACAEVFED